MSEDDPKDYYEEHYIQIRNICDYCGESDLYVQYAPYFCMRLCVDCLETLEEQWGG